MRRVDGKRVVITGAGSGLGRALALVLAGRGCRIGVADIDDEGAAETLEMVRGRGGDGETLHVDVSVPGEVEAMAEHFFSAWGGVDMLVNNAGVAVAGFVGGIRLQDWEWIVGINFWGMVYGCHYFIPRMKRQGGGQIVNVASAAGIVSLPEMAPYNTTKAAVVSLSETLCSELAPHGIGVTVACPSFFRTNLLDSMVYEEEFESEFTHATFEHGRLSPDQVAEAVVEAVERGRLYCVPHTSAMVQWLEKRAFPNLYYRQFAFLNRKGWARPIFLWMARRGMT